MLTQSRLQELLKYNPTTGIFTRLVSKRSDRIGKTAGGLDTYGYVQITVDNRLYLAHRLAWLYMLGELPKQEIDHQNNIRNDNRWCNLREANRFQNMQNRRMKLPVSGIRGAYKMGNRWASFVHSNGERVYLGAFTTKEQAGTAYQQASKTLHKEFQHAPNSNTV